MTKTDFEQLLSIKREIDTIELSLCSPKSVYVSAFYKDYRTGYPVPKVEVGHDDGSAEKEELMKRLAVQKKKLQEIVVKAEEFISAQPDSETRAILRGYYIAGMSQEEIGNKLGYNQSVISRKIKLFWRNRKFA